MKNWHFVWKGNYNVGNMIHSSILVIEHIEDSTKSNILESLLECAEDRELDEVRKHDTPVRHNLEVDQ